MPPTNSMAPTTLMPLTGPTCVTHELVLELPPVVVGQDVSYVKMPNVKAPAPLANNVELPTYAQRFALRE